MIDHAAIAVQRIEIHVVSRGIVIFNFRIETKRYLCGDALFVGRRCCGDLVRLR